MPGDVRTEIHLGARETDGAFCLLVDHPPAGWSLPPHLHHGSAETIYVLEGEFEMTIDGRSELVRPGESCHIPPEVLHCSENVAHTSGRRVVIFSPAGMEDFFLEAGATTEDAEIDTRQALAAAMRHGWEFSR